MSRQTASGLRGTLPRSLAGRRAWFLWLPVPPDASPTERRFYVMGRADPIVLVLTLLALPLWIWWGLWPVAGVAGALLVSWLAVILLARRGRIRASAGLRIATTTILAVLVVALLGWDVGAQYLLVLQMLAALLYPWPRRVSITLAAAVAVLFAALWHYARVVDPVYALPDVPVAVLGTLGILTPFGFAIALVTYPVDLADRAEAELAAEHARSERLLTNVLPVPIARRLKDGEEPIADRVTAASVLFVDIVDFTPLAGRLPAEQVVTLLDALFTRLDRLVDAHGLEKIKTIGDAYMVAAGIPTPRDDHAPALARFALAVRDEFNGPGQDGQPPIEVRIGIDSGPVVAGVIGRRRLLYDLWGDTVNTAARMESHGLPGRIQVTEATHALLGDDFVYHDRGLIDIKGKGKMRTYLLDAPPPATRVGATTATH